MDERGCGPPRVTENNAHALRARRGEIPKVPRICAFLRGPYLLWTPWWWVLLLEVQVLKTLGPGGWTPQTSPYPAGKEKLPTVAAACNGRGDPPAARWPGKERVKRHLAQAEPPLLLLPSTPQPAQGPWSLLSPTSIKFLSLSSSCRRWVSRSPSSFRASSCRRLSSWFRSFSRVALRCIWRRETTMWKPGHRGHRCGAAQRQ